MEGIELRPSGFVASLEVDVSLTSHPLPRAGNRPGRIVDRCPSTSVSPAHVHVHSVRISSLPLRRRPTPTAYRPILSDFPDSRTPLPTPEPVPAGPAGRRRRPVVPAPWLQRA